MFCQIPIGMGRSNPTGPDGVNPERFTTSGPRNPLEKWKRNMASDMKLTVRTDSYDAAIFDLFVAIEDGGLEMRSNTEKLLRELRGAGLKTAVVSWSANCATILGAERLSRLFDVSVDSADMDRLNLKGKPSPDMFLEALRRMGTPPDRTLIFADAVSGIRAGIEGGFKRVVGVDMQGRAKELEQAGAHSVLRDLGDVEVIALAGEMADTPASGLPSALDGIDEIVAQIGGRKLACFLDYDGTLTPIVERPEEAILSEATRSAVRDLARIATVALVSGRGLSDVRSMVKLDDVIYAGSHGFEISGPNNLRAERAEEYLPLLGRAQEEIAPKLEPYSGTRLERKKYSIAIHYRQTAEEHVKYVEAAVDEIIANHPQLRKSSGKKIFEIQPDIPWDKGWAVLWLMKTLGLDDPRESAPMYIGDDTTDEDAFAAIRDTGVTIVIDSGQRTVATRRLNDTMEVRAFLESITRSIRVADEP